MFTRRSWLQAAGAGLFISGALGWQRRARASIPGGSLDPASIPKYQLPVVIPPAMPRAAKLNVRGGKNIDYYEIAVRQFAQQILPLEYPATTVWSYGAVSHPGTVAEGGSFHYPAFTIETKWNAPVQVKWINGLVDANGNYLSHLLPVDPTLHWANPPGGTDGRDDRPIFEETPGPYLGPVPIVTHVHGAHTHADSDGFPEAWYLPDANDIPPGFATTGTYFDVFQATSPLGGQWGPGAAVFEYPNDHRAATLWYHDHTLGMTRQNVYAGPAGFYLLRGGPGDEVVGVLPGPAPALGDRPGMTYYEIPLAIQDRSFNTDGSLFYPDSRAFFDAFPGRYIPDSDVPPIWNPEFFGNTMLVNGRTWPYLDVRQRRYRFRFLNGCNSRFLLLTFDDEDLRFHQIGAEGGFLPAPIELSVLLMAPAERADVIVDFGQLAAGTEVTLLNYGPDEPFGGGIPGVDFEPADPQTTGQVMKFRVVASKGKDRSTPAMELSLPPIIPLDAATNTRDLSLNEEESTFMDGPIAAFLGTVDDDGNPQPLMWSDASTENPALGDTEYWDLHNFTEDAHPIHVHLVQFEVIGRKPIGSDGFRPPEAWESGFKDTVIAYPGETTRIKATFDRPGLFVWHCHILEHEDNEMMRPYMVG